MKLNSMKIKLFICIFVLLLPLVIAYSPWPSSALENNQYYSVVFDEEGEAMVMAKLMFQNTEQVNLKNIIIEIPGQVQLINAVQEIKTKQPNNNYGYYDYGFDYKTIKYTQQALSSGSSIDFTLPQPVKEQEKVVLLIYYKVRGYVQKDWKTYDFNFATVKSNKDVNYVRVAINVPPNLYLKDLDSKVNYVDNIFITKDFGAGLTTEVALEKMSGYSRELEYSPGLIKEGSGLDPFENLQVSGKYSTSWFWLKHWTIIGTIALISGMLLTLFFAIRKIRFKNDKNKEMALFSFISALATLTIVGGSFWLMDNLGRWLGYRYDEIMALTLGLAVVVGVLAALILPPLYLGKKYNFTTGIITVLAQAGWLIVLSLGLLLVLLGFK